MSRGKRGAATDLNHDNWDQEEEKEEAGVFKLAPPDVIENRIIKRALRRRTTFADSTNETCDIKKSLFGNLELQGFAIPETKSNSSCQPFNFLGGSQDKVPTTAPISNNFQPMLSGLEKNTFGNPGLEGFQTREANSNATFSNSNAKCNNSNQNFDVLGGNQGKVPMEASLDLWKKSSADSFSGGKRIKPTFSAPSSLQNFVEPTFKKYSHLLYKPRVERTDYWRRSEEFLRDMANINITYSNWISENLAEDPTSILTRVFKDYLRHVQTIFDREKLLDLDEIQIMVLEAQEQVLNEVVVAKEN